MCGRFVLLADLPQVVDAFHIGEIHCDYAPLSEAYPGQNVYAVVRGTVNRLVQFRWGLIPSWSKEPASGNRMFNARAETLMEKPSFRGIFKRQRCLILADGFYEWEKGEKNKKIPHYYRLVFGEPFGFAGLYDSRSGADGRLLLTCTLITTMPNDLIRRVHDRMPAIISRDDESTWLDPAVSDPCRLMALLHPYPAAAMEEKR